jgi:hypothetical protein
MLADITSEQWPASGWNQWPTSSEYTASLTGVVDELEEAHGHG